MTILLTLIPISLLLGLVGLLAFIWSVGNNQYDDPDGAANRILNSEYDDHPLNLDQLPLNKSFPPVGCPNTIQVCRTMLQQIWLLLILILFGGILQFYAF